MKIGYAITNVYVSRSPFVLVHKHTDQWHHYPASKRQYIPKSIALSWSKEEHFSRAKCFIESLDLLFQNLHSLLQVIMSYLVLGYLWFRYRPDDINKMR